MGLINYSYEIIGDCNNTSEGQFSLFYTASTPPLRIVWTNPTGGTLVDEVLTTYPHVVPNLSAGTYVFSLIDSDPSTNNSTGGYFYITSSDVSKFVRISLIKSFTIVVASMHQEFFLNAPFVFLCKIFIFCNVFACDETRFHIQRLEAPYLVQIHLVHVFLIGLDLAEVHRQII